MLCLWEAGVDGVDGYDVADWSVEGCGSWGKQSVDMLASIIGTKRSSCTYMQRPMVGGRADLHNQQIFGYPGEWCSLHQNGYRWQCFK